MPPPWNGACNPVHCRAAIANQRHTIAARVREFRGLLTLREAHAVPHHIPGESALRWIPASSILGG